MPEIPLSVAEMINACLETGSEAAWTRFVRRFQPLIAASVARVARRYSTPATALIDDLIQETYLRLCRDNCRSLREFRARHDEAIFGFIKVVATSVALDHFRARNTQKRRAEMELEDDRSDIGAVSPSSPIEQATLLEQLDKRLAESETERDRTIFWLYYRQGYTARDIAELPQIGLTQKGVESCIFRLTQSLRNAVNSGKPPGRSKGDSARSALGVVK